MEWFKISENKPPAGEWLEFYDGEKSMGHHLPFNHIDILNHRMEARVNYLHNYTHWRHLSSPST